MTDKAVVKIEGDNTDLKKTLAESKQMLGIWQNEIRHKLGAGGGGGVQLRSKWGGATAGGIFDNNISGSATKLTPNGAGAAGAESGLAGIGMGIAKHLLGPLTAVAVATAVVHKNLEIMHEGFARLKEDQVSLVSMETAIKNMGRNAGTTSEEIQAIGEGLERNTNFTKEMAQDAATVLFRFRNIKNSNDHMFDRALKVSADFAAMAGTSMKDAAFQFGRALEDPIAGMQLLQRHGVKLNEQEQEHIKLLVASGRGLEAQEIIMKRMVVLTKDQAANQSNTLAGNLKGLSFASLEVMIAPFETVIPLATEFVGLLKDIVFAIRDGVTWLVNFGGISKDTFGAFAGYIAEARNLFGIFVDSVTLGAKLMEIGFLHVGAAIESVFGGNSATMRLAQKKKDFWEVTKDIKERSDKVGSFLYKGNAPGGDNNKPDFGMQGRESLGSFEGLEALYKRVSHAAGQATPADRTATATEKQVTLLEIQNQELIDVNSNLNVLIGVLPAPGVLA